LDFSRCGEAAAAIHDVLKRAGMLWTRRLRGQLPAPAESVNNGFDKAESVPEMTPF